MKKKKTRISRVQPRATVYHAVVNYWNSNEKGNWSSRIKYTPLHVCTYYGVLGGRLVIIMSPHERIGVCTCTNLLHRCGIRRTCGPASRRSRVRLSLNRKTCKKMKKNEINSNNYWKLKKKKPGREPLPHDRTMNIFFSRFFFSARTDAILIPTIYVVVGYYITYTRNAITDRQLIRDRNPGGKSGTDGDGE